MAFLRAMRQMSRVTVLSCPSESQQAYPFLGFREYDGFTASEASQKSKDFQIRAFDGELWQMADTPLAVKPMRAAIAT